MAVVKPLARAFESFLILLATFLLHRFLTYPLLFGAIEAGSAEATKAFFVGTLSDFWVAYLLALVVGGVYGVANFFGFPNGARLSMIGLLAFTGAAAAAHVAYIEFFHFQIVPFHLRYLFDPEFVRANGSSLFTARSLATLGGFFGFGFLVLWLDLFSRQRPARLPVAMALLTVLALFAHNRNLHYRVQWFIPENLQVNGFERLYLHAKYSRLPTPLDLGELQRLAALTGEATPIVEQADTLTLFRVLTKAVPHPQGYELPAERIRERVQASIAAKEKPLLVVVLLESLRPSETGYFSPGISPSLTPNLDALAESGVAFTRAYSTGSVTRGAQEATICGYRGARDTSVMRGLVVARISCLGDSLKHRADTFWLHGGDGRFDGQLAFWRDHGMRQTLSIRDFPAAAARTGWGVGDRTFLKDAAARLLTLNHQSQAEFLLGLVLTVSNHIPWDLPADADPTLAAGTYAHPSYRTTAYADHAVGEFVQELKRGDVWKKTLLVLASDHGNSLPPATDLYAGNPQRDDLLASHVNLILSGGLVEDPDVPHRVETAVSQADVAPFLAYVVGLGEARFFADGLFATARSLPLYADLEQGVFVPGLQTAEDYVPLYRRALFQYMSTWHD